MFTIIITIVTVLVSIACFNKPDFFYRFGFSPYEVRSKNQYERFFTHLFVHADWIHLIINMLVFFSFGTHVEKIFRSLEIYGHIFSGTFFFALLYFGGGIIASISSFLKHGNDMHYISVGASGAVSAVLFTSIFFSPLDKILFYGVIPMPGILFGVLYLAYSSYMGKKSRDNINHDAHFWGAVFGFVLPIIMYPEQFRNFLNQLFG